MGHHFGSGSNPAQTRMGYKEIRKRALHDHNPDALIGLEFPAESVEFLRQNFIKKIYRRVIDTDECDSRIKPKPETFVDGIWQESGSSSVDVPVRRTGAAVPAAHAFSVVVHVVGQDTELLDLDFKASPGCM
jgi:hypothetical protein